MNYRMAFWAQSLDNTSPDHFVVENFEDGDSLEVQQSLVSAMSRVRRVGVKVYENQDGSTYAFLKDPDRHDTEWLLSVTPTQLDAAERTSPVRCYIVKAASSRRVANKAGAFSATGGSSRFCEAFIASLRRFVGTKAGRTLDETQYAVLDAVIQTLDTVTGRRRGFGLWSILLAGVILFSVASLVLVLVMRQ